VNRWLNPDLKTYLTEITIDEDQDISSLRPGMTAKVEILVDQVADALFVPVQSVTTIDGAPVCYIWKDGQFAPRSVELGDSNDSFVVVRAGLDEGDVVQLNAPRPQGMPPERKEKEKEKDKDQDREGKGKEKDLENPEVIPTSYREEGGSRRKHRKEKREEKTAEAAPSPEGPGAPAKTAAGSP
jgi:hypothetical protein